MKQMLQIRWLAAGAVALGAVTGLANEAHGATFKITSWLSSAGSGCAFPSGKIYGDRSTPSLVNFNQVGVSSPLASGHTAWSYFTADASGPWSPGSNDAKLYECNQAGFGGCIQRCTTTSNVSWGAEAICNYTVGSCTWTAHGQGKN